MAFNLHLIIEIVCCVLHMHGIESIALRQGRQLVCLVNGFRVRNRRCTWRHIFRQASVLLSLALRDLAYSTNAIALRL